MSHLLIDTSVVLKWFHTSGESEVQESRALRNAHIRGDIEIHVLDLGLYELGNVLVRSLGWTAADVAAQLGDLITVCGPLVAFDPAWAPEASELAVGKALTFYDAAWAAAARQLQIPLVTADSALLNAGVAESATDAAKRLRLMTRQ